MCRILLECELQRKIVKVCYGLCTDPDCDRKYCFAFTSMVEECLWHLDWVECEPCGDLCRYILLHNSYIHTKFSDQSWTQTCTLPSGPASCSREKHFRKKLGLQIAMFEKLSHICISCLYFSMGSFEIKYRRIQSGSSATRCPARNIKNATHGTKPQSTVPLEPFVTEQRSQLSITVAYKADTSHYRDAQPFVNNHE